MKTNISRELIEYVFDPVSYLVNTSESFMTMVNPNEKYNKVNFSIGPLDRTNLKDLNGLCLPINSDNWFGLKGNIIIETEIINTSFINMTEEEFFIPTSPVVDEENFCIINLNYSKNLFLDKEDVELFKLCCIKYGYPF